MVMPEKDESLIPLQPVEQNFRASPDYSEA